MASDLYMTVCRVFLYFLIPPSYTGTTLLFCFALYSCSHLKRNSLASTELCAHIMLVNLAEVTALVCWTTEKKKSHVIVFLSRLSCLRQGLLHSFFCGYVTLVPGMHFIFFLYGWGRNRKFCFQLSCKPISELVPGKSFFFNKPAKNKQCKKNLAPTIYMFHYCYTTVAVIA